MLHGFNYLVAADMNLVVQSTARLLHFGSRMRVCLPTTVFVLCVACQNPDNPCNAGGPQSFTLGTYDAGANSFTAWEDGSTMYMSQISSGSGGSGQGGFSSRRTGTNISWLVSGLKTKKASMGVSLRLDEGEEHYLLGEGGRHTCIPDVGAVGEMGVQFPFEQSDVDLIGQTLELSIEGSYKTATHTAEMSGTLDMEY